MYDYIFFFSSRRRHTRLQGDWSSDVCSSDLLMKSVFDQLDVQPQTVEITDRRTQQKVRVIVNKFVMQYIVANNIGTTITEIGRASCRERVEITEVRVS